MENTSFSHDRSYLLAEALHPPYKTNTHLGRVNSPMATQGNPAPIGMQGAVVATTVRRVAAMSEHNQEHQHEVRWLTHPLFHRHVEPRGAWIGQDTPRLRHFEIVAK